MNFFTQIKENALLPNPHRSFKINPIDKDQVKNLVESYQRNDDIGVITVRRSNEWEDHYEIAFGHHRLEAMRQLGYTEIDCKIVEASDMAMFSMMVDENATQYGGNPASQKDSIAAAYRNVGYALMISDNAEQANAILAINEGDELYTGRSAFERAKTCYADKGQISHDTLVNLLPLTGHTIRDHLASMHADGSIASLITEVEKRVKAELKAHAAERAEIEAAAAKAEKERIAADKAAAIEEKRIAKERKRLNEEAKAASEAREKARIESEQARLAKAEADAEDRQKLRDAAQKQAAADRKAREEAEESQKAAMLKSQEAAKRIAESAYLNQKAVNLFPNTACQSEFKRGVKSCDVALHEQVGIANEILKKHGKDVSKRDVIQFFDTLRKERDRVYAEHQRKVAERRAKESSERNAAYLFDELRSAAGRYSNALGSIDRAIAEDSMVLNWLIDKAQSVTLAQYLDSTDRSTQQIREKLRLRSSKRVKANPIVING